MEKRTSGRYSTNQGASCKTIDALMHGNYGRSYQLYTNKNLQ